MRLQGHKYTNASSIEWSVNYFKNLIHQFSERYGPYSGSLHIPVDGSLSDLPERKAFDTDQAWVNAYIHALQRIVGVTERPIQAFALEGNAAKLDIHQELFMSGTPGKRVPYYTDVYGHPVAYYEPSKLRNPGYILRKMTDILSDILHFASKIELQNEHSHYSARSDMIACYLGLGLVRIENTDASNARDMALMRGTVLFLVAKGYGFEKIRSIYGKVLSDKYGKLLDVAIIQMRESPMLESLMRVDLSGTPQSQYSPLHQVRA